MKQITLETRGRGQCGLESLKNSLEIVALGRDLAVRESEVVSHQDPSAASFSDTTDAILPRWNNLL